MKDGQPQRSDERLFMQFMAFGGCADDCPVVDGRVALPDAPGIGFERKADLWAVMKTA